MSQRLDAIAPDLVRLLASATSEQLRNIAVRLAELVVSRIGLGEPEIHSGLRALRRGEYGDSDTRDAVRELAESLDNAYWELQDLADSESPDQAVHLALFARSRAAHAVDRALDEDPRTAASETAYEVFAALGDLNELRGLVAAGPADAGGNVRSLERGSPICPDVCRSGGFWSPWAPRSPWWAAPEWLTPRHRGMASRRRYPSPH